MKIPADVQAIKIGDVLIIKGKLGVKKANLVNLKLEKVAPGVASGSTQVERQDLTGTSETLSETFAWSGPRLRGQTGEISPVDLATIKKMIVGVTIGFKQKLKLVGVGYKALKKDNELSIQLGFKNPRIITLAPLQVEVRGNGTIIEAKSSSHKVLSQWISNIVKFKPATRDIYKHKGVVRI